MMARKVSDMTKWDRRFFGFGIFVVAAVFVFFDPDGTLRGMHKVLADRLEP